MSRTEFFRSVFEADAKTFAACLRAGKLNEEEPNYGFNVCHVACAHERDDMLSQLLARGVNFEKATVKDVPEAITLFEWRGPAGSTPLMVAAQRGSVKCLKLLLRAGARLDPTDIKGRTATDYAENECMQAISDTHIKREADVEAKDGAQLVAAVAVKDATNRATAEVRLKALELVMNQMNYCADKLLRIDAPAPPSSSVSSPAVSSSSGARPSTMAAGPIGNASSWNTWFVDEYGRLREWRDTLLHDIISGTSAIPSSTIDSLSAPRGL